MTVTSKISFVLVYQIMMILSKVIIVLVLSFIYSAIYLTYHYYFEVWDYIFINMFSFILSTIL